jgi:hypothetical protein
MKIKIRDSKENQVLDFFPKKFRVNPSGLVRALSGFEHVEFKLNGFHPGQ